MSLSRSILPIALFAFLSTGCGDGGDKTPGTGSPSSTAPAIDWSTVRDWTAEKRAAFVEVARGHHEQLRQEGDALRTRLDQVADERRPAVEEALARFDAARDRHRQELFRLSEQVQAGASETFQATRDQAAQIRVELYEAYESAKRELESALSDG